ncbi:magnesium and cobalt transport protein CorA [Bordetella sp. FB-8]|uniref:magnesium and cobalt transport protein CorA n=1 Tax=Bordetella sp. FB-8 TaxID=1159870 RepID=UPI0003644423|nr:magnesium and cobalt transport protein CorA [Bordetella sp. FB-8]
MSDEASSLPPEVMASVAYLEGRRVCDVPVEDIPSYVGRADSLLWTGLREPTEDLLTCVLARLGADARCREDMLQAHTRPKILDYGNMVLVVAIMVEVQAERPAFGETQLLIGNGFLLTVRRGSVAPYADLRARLEAVPGLLKRGSDYVAAELLDLLVDRYAIALHKLEAQVEAAEQKLLIRGTSMADIRKLYRQRRDLLRIHTAVAPMAEICRRLARVEMDPIDAQARPYYGEVADRVQRIDELINALREALVFAFEASQMMAQAQQNDTTRKLAAWAAILAVPTAIAGIYGMNFEFMPELKWRGGYFLILGAMATICMTLYWRLRRAGWL